MYQPSKPRHNWNRQLNAEWRKMVALAKCHAAYEKALLPPEPSEPEQSPDPEEPHTPTIYSYCRCSHRDSEKSGLGLDVQHAQNEAYIAFRLLRPEMAGVVRGKEWVDKSVSGWKRKFIARPEGGKLHAKLRAGDHVVFARIDRGFRSLEDLLYTEELWRVQGITMHFVREGIDASSTHGRLVLKIMASVAEWQAELTSERNQEICDELKRRSGRGNGTLAFGFKWSSTDKFNRKPIPDMLARELMATITELREVRKMTWKAISIQMLISTATRRDVTDWQKGFRRSLSKNNCRTMYWHAKRMAEYTEKVNRRYGSDQSRESTRSSRP